MAFNNIDLINKMKPKYSVASLFCGAGGLDIGFEMGGFKTIWMNDFNKDATDSCRIWCRDAQVVHGDVTKIPAILVPKADVMLGGFPCFVAGTLINVKDRGMIPIEDVQVGDKVLTHKGRYREVLTRMYDKKAEMCYIQVRNGARITCTDNHPFYIRTRSTDSAGNESFTEPKWVKAKDIHDFVKVTDKDKLVYFGVPINKESDNSYCLTEDMVRLLALYLESGKSVTFNHAGLSMVQYFTIRIPLTFYESHKNWFKSFSYFLIDDSPNFVKLKFTCEHNLKMCDLVKLFNKGVNAKTIPDFIVDLPKDLLQVFFDTLPFKLQSNGWYHCGLISREEAHQLGRILLKLGKYEYSCKPVRDGTYDFGYTEYKEEDSFMYGMIYVPHWLIEDDMCWVPIYDIKSFTDSEPVTTYNLEVEEDNSYTVYNIAVHNCQSFSSIGARRGLNDPRGQLYREYIRILKIVQPYMFIGENVEGLLTWNGGEAITQIANDFAEIGYDISYSLYNAADYGVPQDRKRVIIQGWRKDLPLHGIAIPEKKERVTMRDVLGDKPEPEHDDVFWGSFSPRFMSVNRKRGWDDVSFTILAGARGCPLHPSSPDEIKLGDHKYAFAPESEGITRRFAWWEAGIIQSFPEDMVYCGKLLSKYQQIGNAVPPLLGKVFADEILKEFERLNLKPVNNL